MQPNLDESRWDVWGALGGYEGGVVSKVLTEEADTIADLEGGVGYRRAMALVKLCEDRHGSASANPLITVFVEGDGAATDSGVPVGPAILDKIACTGSLEVLKTVDGKPLAMGRRSRVVPSRLRRFILHRDGGCVADGCTSRYRLEAHHIVPWSEGGTTDPENLVTLCWFHHHVAIHGMGFRIDLTLGPGRARFVDPQPPP